MQPDAAGVSEKAFAPVLLDGERGQFEGRCHEFDIFLRRKGVAKALWHDHQQLGLRNDPRNSQLARRGQCDVSFDATRGNRFVDDGVAGAGRGDHNVRLRLKFFDRQFVADSRV